MAFVLLRISHLLSLIKVKFALVFSFLLSVVSAKVNYSQSLPHLLFAASLTADFATTRLVLKPTTFNFIGYSPITITIPHETCICGVKPSTQLAALSVYAATIELLSYEIKRHNHPKLATVNLLVHSGLHFGLASWNLHVLHNKNLLIKRINGR